MSARCVRRGLIETVAASARKRASPCRQCGCPMWEPATGVRYHGWLVASKEDAARGWWAAILSPATGRIEEVVRGADAIEVGAKARGVIDMIREEERYAS